MPPTVATRPPDGAAATASEVGAAVAGGRGRRRVPGDAEAPTSETARKPRPTAAAAEPVQAAPSARLRFMGRSMQPNGLRPPQDGVKARLRHPAGTARGGR